MKEPFILTAVLCICGLCACNSAEPAQEATVPTTPAVTTPAVTTPAPVKTTTASNKAKDKVKAKTKKDAPPQQQIEKKTQQTISTEMMVS